jgi:hypothetical protein
MALASTVTGDGRCIDGSTGDSYIVYGYFSASIVTESEEVREWVALTEAACDAKMASPDTPPAGSSYQYRKRLDNPYTGAYILTRIESRFTLEPVAPE